MNREQQEDSTAEVRIQSRAASRQDRQETVVARQIASGKIVSGKTTSGKTVSGGIVSGKTVSAGHTDKQTSCGTQKISRTFSVTPSHRTCVKASQSDYLSLQRRGRLHVILQL